MQITPTHTEVPQHPGHESTSPALPIPAMSTMSPMPADSLPHLDMSRIAQDLQIRKVQVESVVRLLDEGNTIPFITRYRKERTGGLNEDQIRAVQARLLKMRQLAERKQSILKSIDVQGKLTDELRQAILAAETSKRLEDLYLPFKAKKRTLATAARERGLEPLAQAIWNRDPAVANLQEFAATMINPEKELPTPAEVLAGAGHILAEQIAETADCRSAVRAIIWDTGKIITRKNDKLAEQEGTDYKDYFTFEEALRRIPPHRILAINRGKKENVLSVSLAFDADAARQALRSRLNLVGHPHAEFLTIVADDALARLILPSLETEIHRELRQEAEEHAVAVFARNLRSLLLQRPLRQRRVLGIDPGFRTGCKIAALDEHGNLLDHGVIFPHPTHERKGEARAKQDDHARRLIESKVILETLIRKHQMSVIAIGNGTACRETEELVSDLITGLEKGVKTPSERAAVQAPKVADLEPRIEPPAIEQTASSTVTEASSASPDAAAITAEPALPGNAGNESVLAGPQTPTAAVQSAPESAGPAEKAMPATAPMPPPLPMPVVDPTLPPAPSDLAYIVVNEAGASHYSVSAVGKEEFPLHDATLRGTVSIGRRLQDPLSELVKIDPQNIGVGLYQHDVNPKFLGQSLEGIVESCVNYVGVDLDTASAPLLRHVSGLNQVTAREIVQWRKAHGPFQNREQLLKVPGIGDARYVQAAGFLKLRSGDNPLDQTWVHPESYTATRQLLSDLGLAVEDLRDRTKLEELNARLQSINVEEVAARLHIGIPTLRDIITALARPGRDPREDLPPPIFRKGILKLEDLQPSMELKGTVLNVVDFGAFVDIGLKDSGLVHISQLANRYVKSPYDVVSVGDVVTVWVMTVDTTRRRVSLTMIKPGTERKPAERRPEPERRPPPPRRPVPAGPPSERRDQGPPRGARTGPPRTPQHGQRSGPPRHGPARSAQAGAPPVAGGAPPAQQTTQPAPRPGMQRRPRRPTVRPKLTKDALEGAVPLRTFGELEAFFFAKQDPPTPPPTPPPLPEPAAVASAPDQAEPPPLPAPNPQAEAPPPAEPTASPQPQALDQPVSSQATPD